MTRVDGPWTHRDVAANGARFHVAEIGTGPLVLLFSDDLDATVLAVAAAGGAVTTGPSEFPGGRRFEFSDPSGNVLGVWATT